MKQLFGYCLSQILPLLLLHTLWLSRSEARSVHPSRGTIDAHECGIWVGKTPAQACFHKYIMVLDLHRTASSLVKARYMLRASFPMKMFCHASGAGVYSNPQWVLRVSGGLYTIRLEVIMSFSGKHCHIQALIQHDGLHWQPHATTLSCPHELKGPWKLHTMLSMSGIPLHSAPIGVSWPWWFTIPSHDYYYMICPVTEWEPCVTASFMSFGEVGAMWSP